MYSLVIQGECDYWQRNLSGNMMHEADLPRLRMRGATLNTLQYALWHVYLRTEASVCLPCICHMISCEIC
jgi:hypothetical protein